MTIFGLVVRTKHNYQWDLVEAEYRAWEKVYEVFSQIQCRKKDKLYIGCTFPTPLKIQRASLGEINIIGNRFQDVGTGSATIESSSPLKTKIEGR